MLSYPEALTKAIDMVEAVDHVFEPGIAYVEASSAERRAKDLVASFQIPVDLAALGFEVTLAGKGEAGYRMTVSRPREYPIPTLHVTAKAENWADTAAAIYFALEKRLANVVIELERVPSLQDHAVLTALRKVGTSDDDTLIVDAKQLGASSDLTNDDAAAAMRRLMRSGRIVASEVAALDQPPLFEVDSRSFSRLPR